MVAGRGLDPREPAAARLTKPLRGVEADRDAGQSESNFGRELHAISELLNVADQQASSRLYHVFLSHSHADAELAVQLHDALRLRGLRVFWDGLELPRGASWEEGFADGLFDSALYVPLLSEGALARLCALAAGSACDALLLELRMALELKARDELAGVMPVLVGELQGGSATGAYAELRAPAGPEVVVAEVEERLSDHLQGSGRPPPSHMRADCTVGRVLSAVLAHPPAALTGPAVNALDRSADIIAKAVSAFVPESALPPP